MASSMMGFGPKPCNIPGKLQARDRLQVIAPEDMSHPDASKSQPVLAAAKPRWSNGLRPRVLICHGDADPFISAENRAAWGAQRCYVLKGPNMFKFILHISTYFFGSPFLLGISCRSWPIGILVTWSSMLCRRCEEQLRRCNARWDSLRAWGGKHDQTPAGPGITESL